MAVIYFLSLFPVAFVATSALWWVFQPSEHVRAKKMLILALGVFAAQGFGFIALNIITRWNLPTYDEYVYRIDELLGEPSFALGRALSHTVFISFIKLAYELAGAVAVVVIAAHIWQRSRELKAVSWAFALNITIPLGFYVLFPVCGPRYAFPAFPFTHPQFSPRMMHLYAPPNGIPSVHLATALLILWFTRAMPIGRILSGVFLILTILATLALGEHYLFDLICAIPYTIGLIMLVHTPARAGERLDLAIEGRDRSGDEVAP